MVSSHDLDRWMYRGGHPNAVARTLNHLWTVLVARGLGPKQLAVLEVRGRRTGRTICFPVVIADDAGDRYLVAMLGEKANWVANVRAANGDAILRRSARENIHLDEVAVEDRPQILRRYLAVAPGARAHVGLDAEASEAEMQAVVARIPVFRITARARTQTPQNIAP